MSPDTPRLTVTLTGPREHGLCSGCGFAAKALVDLILWQEHNDRDEPEANYIWLCKRCSDTIIEPHPRLYRRLHQWYPAIGAMDMCTTCAHRDGLACTNPNAMRNRGPGMRVVEGPSTVAFFDGRSASGRRMGWTQKFYSKAPESCEGYKRQDVEPVEL